MQEPWYRPARLVAAEAPPPIPMYSTHGKYYVHWVSVFGHTFRAYISFRKPDLGMYHLL